MNHPDLDTLNAGLDRVRLAPAERGTLELIVARPAEEERLVLTAGQLDTTEGLMGDNWLARGNRHTPDGAAKADAQLTLMNARAAELIAGDRGRWPTST